MAVTELVREGWIIKTDNGRLKFNQERIGCDKVAACERPLSASDHTEIITNDLIVASLRGRAIYVREEDTAARYGVGRTVVRQIFSELAGKRLLKHVPYRGWELRPFTDEDMDAFNETRELVEIRALTLARERLEPAVLQKILEGNCVCSESGEIRVDDSLHTYFVTRSNNRYLQDFFELHIPYFRLFFCLENSEEIRASVMNQHRAILEPLLARKWSDAKRALSRHLRYSHPLLRQATASLRSARPEEAESMIRSMLSAKAPAPIFNVTD
jgi:DNA-binding GntR family transcriptional regulator